MMFPDEENDALWKLSEYTPGCTQQLQNHGYKRVCLQFFGITGHGKSDIIKSCLRVMGNRECLDLANPDSAHETTAKDRKEYTLQNNVYITDTQALSTLQEDELWELQYSQLQTLLDLSWENETGRTAQTLIRNAQHVKPVIIVPIYVYSAECPCTPDFRAKIDPFIRQAYNITEIFPIIVITRCRTSDTKSIEFTFLELGANYVFFIENYTKTETENNPEAAKNILSFLDTCLQEADRGIEMKLGKDPKEEFKKQAQRLLRKKAELDEKTEKKLNHDLYRKNKRPKWILEREDKKPEKFCMEQRQENGIKCIIG